LGVILVVELREIQDAVERHVLLDPGRLWIGSAGVGGGNLLQRQIYHAAWKNHIDSAAISEEIVALLGFLFLVSLVCLRHAKTVSEIFVRVIPGLVLHDAVDSKR